MARQLALFTATPQPILKKAKRDWRLDEFERALMRNGLRLVWGGTGIEDPTTGGIYACVWANKRMRRRATLAKILRKRDSSVRMRRTA